jgi:flagellar assembly factor FliW
MDIQTRRFGPITVADEDQLSVPEGIPGFRTMRRVVLMGAGAVPTEGDVPTDHTMFWMQDLDNGDLAFLCIIPWGPFPGYDLEIDEAELAIEDETDVRVLNLVTVQRADGVAHLTANLRAPLVVDVRRRVLHQVILSDSRWAVNAPFAQTASGTR